MGLMRANTVVISSPDVAIPAGDPDCVREVVDYSPFPGFFVLGMFTHIPAITPDMVDCEQRLGCFIAAIANLAIVIEDCLLHLPAVALSLLAFMSFDRFFRHPTQVSLLLYDLFFGPPKLRIEFFHFLPKFRDDSSLASVVFPHRGLFRF